jgi:hypothetical protein
VPRAKLRVHREINETYTGTSSSNLSRKWEKGSGQLLGERRTYGLGACGMILSLKMCRVGLHRIERLMWLQVLRARPQRRRLPPDCQSASKQMRAAEKQDVAAPSSNENHNED